MIKFLFIALFMMTGCYLTEEPSPSNSVFIGVVKTVSVKPSAFGSKYEITLEDGRFIIPEAVLVYSEIGSGSKLWKVTKQCAYTTGVYWTRN